MTKLTCVLSFGCVVIVATAPLDFAGAGEPLEPQSAAPVGSLARFAPADTRFFLELRDLSGLMQSPQARILADAFQQLVSPPSPATNVPPSGPGAGPRRLLTWRERMASTMGLRDPTAVDLLFGGRVALVADTWENVSEAVLLAEPRNTAGLESALAALVKVGGAPGIRQFALTADHELASN